jgi:hypothetical protein
MTRKTPPEAKTRKRPARPAASRGALTPESRAAIAHLKQAVAGGRPWHLTLLEAVGMWTSPWESYRGRVHEYVVGNEAFDLYALARRLASEVRDQIPAAQLRRFLQEGRFPQEVTEAEMRSLVGPTKLTGLMNYWYGVALEGALLAAVRDEVRKERLGRGIRSQAGIAEAAFIRVYGHTRQDLHSQFLLTLNGDHRRGETSEESKAFAYWLFKHRVNASEKAKVASDTRKALLWLQHRNPEPLYTLLEGLALIENSR